MAKKQQVVVVKKGGGGGGKILIFILIVVGLAAALAYLMNSCGSGFGLFGKGAGEGGGSATASGKAPASAPSAASSAAPSATGPSQGTTTVVVEEPFILRVAGTTCKIGKADESRECDAACDAADTYTKSFKKREVKLYPAKGAQEVVEKLKKCITDKGMTIGEYDD